MKTRMLNWFVWRVRYKFLDRFGQRTVIRSEPAHGDWDEEPGWWWRGTFYPVVPTWADELVE